MSLHARVARLEVAGGSVPSQTELREAYQLTDRYFRAIRALEIFGPDDWEEPPPQEVQLMRAAEASGCVAAARDVIQRYRRAQGHDDSQLGTEERRARVMALLDEAFSEVVSSGPGGSLGGADA
jgi:hypothetical protein